MASNITSYTFPAVYAVQGDDNNTYVGYKQYYDGNTEYFDFGSASGDYIQIREHPQTDPYTRPLIVHLQDLDNGLAVTLEYFCELTTGTNPYYHVTGKIVTKDKATGETIPNFEYGGKTYVGESAIDFNAGQYMYGAPTIKYYPSATRYIQSPTNIGDPADRINTLGTFIMSRNQMSHPTDEVQGKMKLSSFTSSYYMTPITNGLVENDEELEELQEGIISAGDGTNPFIDPLDPSDNPFENNPSGTGGGKGKYTKNGDTTGKPGLPSSDVLNSGFIAMYTPSSAQLQSLGAKLWSDDFFDNFLKLWNDPMEAIISLGLVPFSPTSSGNTNCQIGNYDTEISMPRVTAQYQTLSCGSVTVSEYWGSALDYSPYTEAEIFLPFVGMKKLDIDDVMDHTISVDYNVDLLGGEAVCYVTVDDVVLYDFRCNLQTSIPISSSSYASLYSNIIKGVSGMAIGAAAGGATGAAAGAITSAVNVVTSKHSAIERGSELSPNAGVLGLLTPYIILHRVVQSLPSNFNHFKGYPSNVTKTLGACSGYTEVEYIHLDGINATDEEKMELLTILKEGIVI